MKHHKKQDFRVFFSLPDGGKGSLVVKGQPGHDAAAGKTDEMLRGSALVGRGEGFRVTRVRPLRATMSHGQALAEAMLAVLVGIGIPLAGMWQLLGAFN